MCFRSMDEVLARMLARTSAQRAIGVDGCHNALCLDIDFASGCEGKSWFLGRIIRSEAVPGSLSIFNQHH